MAFKLGIILVMTELFLLAFAMPPNFIDSTNATEMTTDAYGCFKKGELWKDLGTNESIIAAYDEQWCSWAIGMWGLGQKVKCAVGLLICLDFQLICSQSNLCIRGDPIAHAFIWEWEITKVPDGPQGGYVSHVCVSTVDIALEVLAPFQSQCPPTT